MASGEVTKQPYVCIVGGGIGGLALAIALHRNGVQFDLFEAAASFGEIGAGVALASNARRALKLLGVEESYEEQATVSKTGVFFEFRDGESGQGNLITTKMQRQRPGPSSIHRASLIDILASPVPRERCHFNKRLVNVDGIDDADVSNDTSQKDLQPLRLTFADGSSFHADVVVGCDGIRSAVRPYVVAEANLEWTGTRAYRALIKRDKLVDVIGREKATHYFATPQMFCGRDRHALLFAIDHGETINIVAFRTDRSRYPRRPEFPQDEPWTQPATKHEMLADFEGFNQDICNILDTVEGPSKWALHQLIPPLSTYVRGHICLLGDAAHGGTPHQGALAGQALEDAVVLAQVLAWPGISSDLTRALRVYDAVRRPRANRVLETSLENSDVLECAGPWAAGCEAIRQDAEQRYDWIWEHDVQDDVRHAMDLLTSS